MKINTSIFILSLLLALNGCKEKEKSAAVVVTNTRPEVLDQGKLIRFKDQKSNDFFATETVNTRSLSADFVAPAHVVATIIRSQENSGSNLVLFDDPTQTANYAGMLQDLFMVKQIQKVNIVQKQIELERIKDLSAHGAASGREVLEAQTALAMEQTNLSNQKAALVEHETILKTAGFDPTELKKMSSGQVLIICDVPESQVNKLQIGNRCTIQFTAFPDEKTVGQIDAFGDVVDNVTRTIKLRIGLANPAGKYRAGMFANVSFGISEGSFISVAQTSIITVQGKDYVFVKKANLEYELRPIQIGQQINDRIIVFSGLKENESVVTKGAMQLKGLSFGY